jgi:hypothetical protein
MRALAYLLGARALDLARDPGPARRSEPEVALGPIATTEESASAWRRWAEAREAAAGASAPAGHRRQVSPEPVRPSRAPA